MLKSIAPIEAKNLLRGRFRGYLDEPGVAKDSRIETFAALRLDIHSWRWEGVPFYIRAGKCLPVTCTEVVVRLRRAPRLFPAAKGDANYVRFRISPDVTMGIGMNVMDAEEAAIGEPIEITASRHPAASDMDAYERVLGDAMAGHRALFAREDYVEEAWRIVDPVLKAQTPLYDYAPGSWGPDDKAGQVTPPGGWVDPVVEGDPK